MKRMLFILGMLMLASLSQAAIRRVASDGSQPFTQISAAITASAAGDTIVVLGGSYTGFTVDRKLVIIGAGTNIAIGEGVLVAGTVEVTAAADSTELRSLWLQTSSAHSTDSISAVLRIHRDATNIFVWRCFIENLSASNSAANMYIGNNASADIVQCVLWNSGETSSSSHYGIVQRPASSVVVTSCVLSNIQYGITRFNSSTGAFATVKHCVFTASGVTHYPIYTEAAGVIENSAFLVNAGSNQNFTALTPSFSFSYCTFSSGIAPGATNFQADSSNFVNIVFENTRSSDYHLSVGSILEDAGNPGSPNDLDNSQADIGIYGGQHPYVDGGIPDYPFAVHVEVPYTAPLNGVMRIWARGRVGPGY